MQPICQVHGCILNATGHARWYNRLEATVGRQAADDFDDRHQPLEKHPEDVCLACPQVRDDHDNADCPSGQFEEDLESPIG
jgi:hypothetical protein